MHARLGKWYDAENGVYTREYYDIPEEGVEIWCAAWSHMKVIKPYGDSTHVLIGSVAPADDREFRMNGEVYHCDEFMEILERQKRAGHVWGIDTPMITEQYVNGSWRNVQTAEQGSERISFDSGLARAENDLSSSKEPPQVSYDDETEM